MHPAFIRKLSSLVDLAPADIEQIGELPYRTLEIERHAPILRRGDNLSFAYVILEGWAARSNIRRNGTRRITGLMMPGDFCGIHAVCAASMDHSLTALTHCLVATIEAEAIGRVVQASPAVGQALWRAKLADEASLRTWLLNSEDARRALAHLLCELHARALQAGLTHGNSFELPLTQQDIGDALGITAVHTNRMMQQLREEGLVELAHLNLQIPDIAALRAASSFTTANLHLFYDAPSVTSTEPL